jgi:arylsulfatase A-like enzyme
MIRIIILAVVFLLCKTELLAQPNILWITIEDTSPDFIGVYGNKNARTPVIDKLANEGIRFNNSFSNNTVCSPSRATIITGVKTTALGTGHHRCRVTLPSDVKGFPSYLRAAGYYTSNNFKTDYNITKAQAFTNEAWNESSEKATWRNRKPGQPFFAVYNFMESHQSRTMTWPYKQYKKEIYDSLPVADRITDNDFEVPPIYNNSPETRKQLARVYNSLKFTDNLIGNLLKKLEEDGLRDSTIIFFYADHGQGMPRGKTNGIDYGYRVPFVIWFPPMYSHLSPWGKAGIVTDELIAFEDLAPTILDIAGAEIPNYMKGRVLVGSKRSAMKNEIFMATDRADNGPDLTRTVTNGRYIYSRNYMAYMPELRYIRYLEISDIKKQMRKDYKAGLLNKIQESFFLQREPEFLFDLQADPWELNNLATDKQSQNKLQFFRGKLDSNIIAEKDVHFLPEYETDIIQTTNTLYQFRQSNQVYPIKEIYEAAALSGFRNKQTCAKQVSLLNSKNHIVRYWAVVGLLSQPHKLLQKYRNKITAAMNDRYPPVSTTAAAIMYDLEENEQARKKLEEGCLSDNQNLSLMAINYLLYLSNSEVFTKTIYNVKSKKGSTYNIKAACNDFMGKYGLIENNTETEN